MSIIDRIKSIADKLGVKITGETISELLASLDVALDNKNRYDEKKFEKRQEKKFEFTKGNKRNYDKNVTGTDI